ncbi:MAG: glutamine-hydrolyzing GMP synthase [Bacteroidales bacterium]
MTDRIIILDFGSQLTQLIGRRIREHNVYCEIYPYNKIPKFDKSVKGLILSGSPYSVRDKKAPAIDLTPFKGKLPILAICYGAQYIAQHFGGDVEPSNSREYGRAILNIKTSGLADAHTSNKSTSAIFKDVPLESQVWMSHGDTIMNLPEKSEIIASTADVKNAAYRIQGEETYCLQFHPEVFHTEFGSIILNNFVKDICKCKGNWTSESYIESTVTSLRKKIGKENVILGLSGGVDSTVAAVLLNKAIGHQLYCIFVNNGLLRQNEFEDVLASYKDMGLNVKGVDASGLFYNALKGISDPESKRKAIGKTFIDVFNTEAKKVNDAHWLAQGTIYPDVIESSSVNGPSQTIKSHHNVGGLPKEMNLSIVEPLRSLFKDEVRRVGRALNIKNDLVSRHPFPGPGLGIRVLGEVSEEKLRILREADDVYIKNLKNTPAPEGWAPASGVLATGCAGDTNALSLYDTIWQAGTMLLPIKSVGVMGDERTYEFTIALRAVSSTDGMTADWVHLPYDFLAHVSNEIINKVRGVNRVTYDISSKPPATIEWE